MRPACFGMPVAVSDLSPTCRECPNQNACTAQALSFLDTLSNTESVKQERQRIALVRQGFASTPHAATDPEGRAGARRALTPEQESVVAQLPQQVATMVKKLFASGWFEFARRELHAGRNPGRNDWQRLLCGGLLRGGITRAQLQLAYQDKLGMTAGSAKVRVSKAVATFLAGRLLIEREGSLQLSHN